MTEKKPARGKDILKTLNAADDEDVDLSEEMAESLYPSYIKEKVDNAVFHALTDALSFFAEYRSENSLPFAERVDFGALYDFFVEGTVS